jgi:serine protease Do
MDQEYNENMSGPGCEGGLQEPQEQNRELPQPEPVAPEQYVEPPHPEQQYAEVLQGRATPEILDQVQQQYAEPSQQEPLQEHYAEPEPPYEQENYIWDYGGDARFSEVNNADPPPMFTPGIYTNERFGQVYKPPAPATRAGRPEKRERRAGRIVRVICLALVCALLGGAAAYGVTEYRIRNGDFESEAVKQVVFGGSSSEYRQEGANTPVVSTGAEMSGEDIYDMACQQVVSITIDIEGLGGFFSQSGSGTAVSGSGFIISGEGYILTNYHVVELAYHRNLPIIVHLNDDTEYTAQLIGFESSSDVALLKINATGLAAAAIGNSDGIRVGQRVYAVGNPFGELVYTMTDGIISALDRVVTVENKSINTFQLSAAVNPGNSGGPVYSTKGEIIGIVSAKFMSSTVEGIGFAIPINDAIEIAIDLIEHGYIPGRAFMGITAETVTRGHADYFGWDATGVYVKTVTPDSAADRAGLMPGDIIMTLGDNEVDSYDTLVQALRKFSAADTTEITVWRSGEELTLTITFDENMTAGQPQNQQPQTQQPSQQPQLP